MNAEEEQYFLDRAWRSWDRGGVIDSLLTFLYQRGRLNAETVGFLVQDAANRGIDISGEFAYYGEEAAALAQQAVSETVVSGSGRTHRPPKRTALAAQPLPNVVVAQNGGWPKTLTKEDYMQWTRLCERPWHYKLCELEAPLSYRRIAMGILSLAIEEGNRNVNLGNRRLRHRLGSTSTTISDAITWLVDNGFLKLHTKADRAKRHATVYRLNGMGNAGTLPPLPLEIATLNDLGVQIVYRALEDGCSANPSALEGATGLSRRTCERALAKLPALMAAQ